MAGVSAWDLPAGDDDNIIAQGKGSLEFVS